MEADFIASSVCHHRELGIAGAAMAVGYRRSSSVYYTIITNITTITNMNKQCLLGQTPPLSAVGRIRLLSLDHLTYYFAHAQAPLTRVT